MADNVQITAGSGTTMATDDISGVHYPKTKIGFGGDDVYTAVADTDPLPIYGGRPLRRKSESFTRPANTTAYAAGDVICNSTSSPTILEFTGMAYLNGGYGRILGASLTSSNNPATNISARLFLFSSPSTGIDNDNSPFTPTDSEIKDVQGVILFAGAAAVDGDASSNIFNGTPVSFPPQGITYKCDDLETSLYGILVADAAYTPASGEEIQITLEYELG